MARLNSNKMSYALTISIRMNFILEFSRLLPDAVDEIKQHYSEKAFGRHINFAFFVKGKKAEKTFLVFLLAKQKIFKSEISLAFKGEMPICHNLKNKFNDWVEKLGPFEVFEDWGQQFAKYSKIKNRQSANRNCIFGVKRLRKRNKMLETKIRKYRKKAQALQTCICALKKNEKVNCRRTFLLLKSFGEFKTVANKLMDYCKNGEIRKKPKLSDSN